MTTQAYKTTGQRTRANMCIRLRTRSSSEQQKRSEESTVSSSTHVSTGSDTTVQTRQNISRCATTGAGGLEAQQLQSIDKVIEILVLTQREIPVIQTIRDSTVAVH